MEPRDVPDIVRAQNKSLQFNCEALDIYDGNLLPYLDKMLSDQLSAQSYLQARYRLSPINILPKIIDKLTNIYQTTVIRAPDGSAQDQKIVEYYVNETHMNPQMNCNNELYNLCGSMLLQPYAYRGKPKLRSIPNDKFVVYSEDQVEPNKPTHIILLYMNQGKQYYWVYSDQQIYIVNQEGKVDIRAMARAGLPDDWSNPFGKMPFVYGNSSKYKLVPTSDNDGITMVKLLPLMLSDLNYAAMFQCFSILYTINATPGNIKYAPNVMWEFQSNPSSDQKPEIGTIKPQVDYPQVIGLIKDQLSMWLGTKGIRASSIDALSKDNFASGISKVIDEMDTFEARQKQVTCYQQFETEYWDLIANHMHPYWVSQKQIENVGLFSSAFKMKTDFAVQLPMQTRGQVVVDLKTEYEAGFISRKMAIQKLNPQLSEKEVDDLMAEIDLERTVTVPELPGLTQQGSNVDDVAAPQPGNSGQSGSFPTSGASGSGN